MGSDKLVSSFKAEYMIHPNQIRMLLDQSINVVMKIMGLLKTDPLSQAENTQMLSQAMTLR